MRRGVNLISLICILLIFISYSNLFCGEIYNKAEFDSAIAEFTKIVKLEPENKKAWDILIMLQNQAEKKSNAQQYYDEGMRFMEEKNWQDAVDRFNLALKYDPQNEIIIEALRKARIQLMTERTFTMDFIEEDLETVLLLLAQESGQNILLPKDLTGRVTVKFVGLPFKQALEEVLRDTEWTYEERKEYIKIVPKVKREVKDTFNKSEKIFNISFKDFELKDVLETLGKMMEVNVIFDDSAQKEAKKKVNLAVNKMALIDIFNLVLKMYDLKYKKFNEETYIIMTKKKFVESNYDEDRRIRKFIKLVNADPDDVIKTLKETEPYKSTINPKNIKVIKKIGEGLKGASKVVGVFVYDTPENIKLIEDFIKVMDVKRKQVIISVRFMEVSRLVSQKLGLDIDFNPTGSGDDGFDKFIDPKIFQNFRAKLIKRGGARVSTDKLVLSATLDFLEQNNFTTTIASPSIRTLDGHKASLNISSVQPVQFAKPVVTTNAAGDQTTTITYDWRDLDFGVVLNVTPIIHNDNEVSLDIDIKNNSIGDKVEGNDQTFRYGSTKNDIKTLVRVKDGETVIMGGIINKTHSESIKTVPFFNKLPFIGKLFDHKTTEDAAGNKELVIFITPYIVNRDDEEAEFKEEKVDIESQKRYLKLVEELKSELAN